MSIFLCELNLNKINNFDYIQINEKNKINLTPKENEELTVQNILNMYDEKENIISNSGEYNGIYNEISEYTKNRRT